jgi:hypothetical protein
MQNRSSAVMQQRSSQLDPGSRDYFGTPPWATRALLRAINPDRRHTVWEPAAGAGFMVRPLAEHFAEVIATDIAPDGTGDTLDFLSPEADAIRADWIITNPPFVHANAFALAGIRRARVGVALFVRSAFLEGRSRYMHLYAEQPPTQVFQFVDRVVLHEGDPPDPDVPTLNRSTGKMAKPSTATAYVWMVWQKGGPRGTSLRWLATPRENLTRQGDYVRHGAGRDRQ